MGNNKKWKFLEHEERIPQIVEEYELRKCVTNKKEMFKYGEKVIATFLDLQPDEVYIEDDVKRERRNFYIQPSKEDGRRKLLIYIPFKEFEELEELEIYFPPYDFTANATRTVRDWALYLWGKTPKPGGRNEK